VSIDDPFFAAVNVEGINGDSRLMIEDQIESPALATIESRIEETRLLLVKDRLRNARGEIQTEFLKQPPFDIQS